MGVNIFFRDCIFYLISDLHKNECDCSIHILKRPSGPIFDILFVQQPMSVRFFCLACNVTRKYDKFSLVKEFQKKHFLSLYKWVQKKSFVVKYE